MKKNVDTVEQGFTDRRRTMDVRYRTMQYDRMFFSGGLNLSLGQMLSLFVHLRDYFGH